jgi:hypothetical protein
MPRMGQYVANDTQKQYPDQGYFSFFVTVSPPSGSSRRKGRLPPSFPQLPHAGYTQARKKAGE